MASKPTRPVYGSLDRLSRYCFYTLDGRKALGILLGQSSHWHQGLRRVAGRRISGWKMHSSRWESRFRKDHIRSPISVSRSNAGRNGTLLNSGRTSRSWEEKPSVGRLGYRWDGEERATAFH